MELIRIACFIGLLPVLYPIKKILYRKDLNLFDLIIVFHSLNFCISPLISNRQDLQTIIEAISDDVTIRAFIYYISFMLTILITDFYYTNKKGRTNSLINLSKSFSTIINSMQYSKTLEIALFVFSITDFLYLMPKFAVLFVINSFNEVAKNSYLESSLISIAVLVHTISFTISLFLIINNIKEKRKTSFVLIIAVIIFSLVSFLVGRRYFLSFTILNIFAYYSVYRKEIKIYTLSLLALFTIIFYIVVFPFYNVIRNSTKFDDHNPTSSVISVFSYGFGNFGKDHLEATKSTESRSIMLYGYLYDYIRKNPEAQNGKITLAAIDQAIPKVINPQKGGGTDPLLERLSGKWTDLSNSFLLHAYSDFHYSGFILCYLLYLFLIIISIFYFDFLSMFSNHYVIRLCYTICQFYLAYDVENKFEGVMANIIQLPLTIIILLIVFKLVSLFSKKQIAFLR